MTKKSNVPEHIFFRVLEKSRKEINKKHKQEKVNTPKTLMEVFENEEDPNNRG